MQRSRVEARTGKPPSALLIAASVVAALALSVLAMQSGAIEAMNNSGLLR
jgi:hypothetical protein